MRNLKRALSLAMASVMLLGMMVVGTSAASFQDVDSSNDLEAIEVMNAVGVMQGDERGFRPNDPIARNEIAKVMALLLKLSPEDYTYASTPFTDVPDWAKPYVAACYANGITNGTSATTYSGGDNVTAVQAARMMLRALGYLQNKGDDGDDWVLATVTQASKIDLFDGVNQTNAHAALTRNQVATMAVNALESTRVEDKSTKGMEVNTSDGTTVTQAYVANYVKVSVDKEGAKNYTGASGDGEGTQQLCEFLYGTDLKKFPSSADDFGRPASKWRYKSQDVVTAVNAPDLTYTKDVKLKDIYADLGKPKSASLSETPREDNAYVVGKDTTNWKTTSDKVGAKGAVTEVWYDTDKDEVTITSVTTYLAQAVKDYDEDDDELDIRVVTGNIGLSDSTLDGEDFAIENYKEDDYILITAASTDNVGTSYEVKSVAPATLVENVTVSSYKVNDSVTAGGSKYEYSKVATTAGTVVGDGYIDGTTAYGLNDTAYTLILDDHGYVLGVKTYSDENQLTDYLFVKDAGTLGVQVQAKVVFMDGTSATVTVDEVDGKDANKLNDTASKAGKADNTVYEKCFYTYTVNKDGTYDLETVAVARQGNTDLTAKDGKINPDQAANAMITGTNKPDQPANSKTVFVANDKAFVGVSNAPEVTDGSVVYWMLDSKSNYLLAVYTDKDGASATDESKYIYILKENTSSGNYGVGEDADGNKYYVYDAVVDGKKTTIQADTQPSNVEKIGVYEITGYKNGYAKLKLVSAIDAAKGATGDARIEKIDNDVAQSAITCSNGVLKVNSAYVVLDDAQILFIDAGDSNSTKTVSGSYLDSLKAGTYDVWTIDVSSNTNSKIETVYVYKNK